MPHDDLARKLKIDPARLTAIQSGFDGIPSPVLIFQIERELELSRFELEDLKAAARLSNPQPVLNAAGLDEHAVEFINLLAQYLPKLPARAIGDMADILKKSIKRL